LKNLWLFTIIGNRFIFLLSKRYNQRLPREERRVCGMRFGEEKNEKSFTKRSFIN